jgi:hypothetical protein
MGKTKLATRPGMAIFWTLLPLIATQYFLTVCTTSAYLYYKDLFIFLQQHVFASLHHWAVSCMYIYVYNIRIYVYIGYVNAKLYFHVLKLHYWIQ